MVSDFGDGFLFLPSLLEVAVGGVIGAGVGDCDFAYKKGKGIGVVW